jgi:hypothetical protein
MLDIDRLHRVLDQIYAGDSTGAGAGRTTAYMHMLLGEVWLADAGSCFVYVAETPTMARHAMLQFLVYVSNEPTVQMRHTTTRQIILDPTHISFFFVDVDYFVRRFAFLGTAVSKVFIDVPPINSTAYDAAVNKAHQLHTNGTDII